MGNDVQQRHACAIHVASPRLLADTIVKANQALHVPPTVQLRHVAAPQKVLIHLLSVEARRKGVQYRHAARAMGS